jgi:hypothetical protein
MNNPIHPFFLPVFHHHFQEKPFLGYTLSQPTIVTIDGNTFMTKDDFQLVDAKKIPPVLADSQNDYPGSLCQYEVSAIKDKMDEKGNLVYYGMNFFLNQIATTSTYFTLALEFDSSASNVKASVLALGRYDGCRNSIHTDRCHAEPFNAYSSFSKSTLAVPEVATAAIVAAPLGALGLMYTAKRRKK